MVHLVPEPERAFLDEADAEEPAGTASLPQALLLAVGPSPVTIIGNPRETIELSEVAGFISESATTEKGRPEPKKADSVPGSFAGES